MAARIRKGDRVIVITGKDKGRTGEVLRVFPDEHRAIVQGINVARRHQRQTVERPAIGVGRGSARSHRDLARSHWTRRQQR